MKRLYSALLVLFSILNLFAQAQYHETQIINASQPTSYSLSSDGNRAIAGLITNEANSIEKAGEVDIYKRSGDTWQLYQTLHSPTPSYFGHFGKIVKISYRTLIAYEEASDTENPGKVYTYQMSEDGNWTLINIMENLDCNSIDIFETEFARANI